MFDFSPNKKGSYETEPINKTRQAKYGIKECGGQKNTVYG